MKNINDEIRGLKQAQIAYKLTIKEKDAEIKHLEERHNKCCKSNEMYQFTIDRQAEEIKAWVVLSGELKVKQKEQSSLLDEMVSMLKISDIQIKYLHKKFKETGSGNSVILSIEALINKHNQLKQKG